MDFSTIRAVVFDKDGVLVDSEAINLRSAYEIFRVWGFDLDDHVHDGVAIIEIIQPADLDALNLPGNGDFAAFREDHGIVKAVLAGNEAARGLILYFGSQKLVQITREDFETGTAILDVGLEDDTAPADIRAENILVHSSGRDFRERSLDLIRHGRAGGYCENDD